MKRERKNLFAALSGCIYSIFDRVARGARLYCKQLCLSSVCPSVCLSVVEWSVARARRWTQLRSVRSIHLSPSGDTKCPLIVSAHFGSFL